MTPCLPSLLAANSTADGMDGRRAQAKSNGGQPQAGDHATARADPQTFAGPVPIKQPIFSPDTLRLHLVRGRAASAIGRQRRDR